MKVVFELIGFSGHDVKPFVKELDDNATSVHLGGNKSADRARALGHDCMTTLPSRAINFTAKNFCGGTYTLPSLYKTFYVLY